MTKPTKSPTQQVAANAWGIIAQAALSVEGTAVVRGNTSRGIFIKTESKWVIFLSYELHHGPMTVNLKGNVSPLRELPPGALVQLSPNLITVPKPHLEISLREAFAWQPKHTDSTALDPHNMRSRLTRLAKDAYAHKKGAGLSGQLPTLADFPSEQAHEIDQEILSIHKAFSRKDSFASLTHLEKLLGRGSGLTPSGDDFIIGLLLTLNRWQTAFEPEKLSVFNKNLIEAAYTKTTTLSANLIECAAEGQADERLIATVDFLITGAGPREQILDDLLNWGNSSGVDALVGMLVVFTNAA